MYERETENHEPEEEKAKAMRHEESETKRAWGCWIRKTGGGRTVRKARCGRVCDGYEEQDK